MNIENFMAESLNQLRHKSCSLLNNKLNVKDQTDLLNTLDVAFQTVLQDF